MEKTMDKIVALAKSRGFVYPGSEIYGGLANTWDYGNLGVELKNNVKRAWWQKFIQESPYNVGVDCAILMNSQTWVASGHLGGFSDPLMDCKSCKERFRADKLIEDYMAEHNIEIEGSVDGWSQEQMKQYIDDNNICCPSCGKHDFTDIRQFNLMFKTFQGVTEDAKNTVYLRPETAQGIFVNFKNVQRTSRKKIPFGIGQIGKSFRNEITPGNFTFRTREFEQMELEFFCEPGTDLEWFAYWKQHCIDWLQTLGIKPDEMRARDHSPEELCFYSKATTDLEFLFPFGWGELWGIADRTDYDLTQHQNTSGQDMTYFDDEKIAFSLVPSAMWPSVPKIIPEKQLGTAYALIFWVQNIGLSMVPLLIGWILDTYCKIDNGTGKPAYDYTIPMAVFTCFGVLALFIALMLKREDRIKGYGLELPNIQKDADKAEAEIIAKEMIAEP